ncbi:hypothetical protein EV368DRAFT_86751 [Lentinula lateritia]|uniref:Uncharacterized protein n=1 Tax=Lentinula aff. lateritia TaxID=2804960 RepID=A0ACC1TXV1_9AGAR|nr:hypothetical protein F5876DRAFT_78025 [Lentinula aff. lateritia]KAJ3848316.1 hypothetical protein EV368DRAFT_86751 [Lentinula lateritia]
MRFVVTWVSLVCLFFSAVYAIRTPSESSTNNLPLILHANGLDESGQKAIAMLIQAMLKEKEQWPPTSLAALKLTFIPSRMEDEGSPADGVTTFYVSGNFANCLAGCKGLVDQEGKGQAALVTSGEPVYTSEGSVCVLCYSEAAF